MGMKINEILQNLKELSKSQGHWGRILEDLLREREEDVDAWKETIFLLEREEFESVLDLILYFKEGKTKFPSPQPEVQKPENYITLWAEDYDTDVWQDYCDAAHVSYECDHIRIWFDLQNVTGYAGDYPEGGK